MAYANIFSHNIGMVRAAGKESAAVRAAKNAEFERQCATMFTESDIKSAMPVTRPAPEPAAKKVTFEDVMLILSTDPLSGEPLAAAKSAPAPAKPNFISRQALIDACQAMSLDAVLFEGWRRQTSASGGYAGYAAERALANFIGATFGQRTHTTKSGGLANNPAWFRQLYTELAYGHGDITPASILQALA